MRTRTDTGLSAGVRGNLIDATSCGRAGSNPGARRDRDVRGSLSARFDAQDRRDKLNTSSPSAGPPTALDPGESGSLRARAPPDRPSGPTYAGDLSLAPAQHQVPPVQPIILVRDRFWISDPLVVQVAAAFPHRPPGLTETVGQPDHL